jgi:hypothetical protein
VGGILPGRGNRVYFILLIHCPFQEEYRRRHQDDLKYSGERIINYTIVNIQNKEEEKKSPSPRRRQAMSVER